MRIWFIHPQYYDKKGLLAQWNEALILRNVIYGSRNEITVQKLKAQSVKKTKKTQSNDIDEELSDKKRVKSYSKPSRSQKIATTEIPKGYGWINHPFSKRITRYNKELQKNIINTYLNHIRNYGVKHFNINFNEKYLDAKCINDSLRIPILIEHIKKDQEDALFKMQVRDTDILEFVKTVKNSEDFRLNKPFYYETDLGKYLDSLSDEYYEWSENDLKKFIGTEIEFSDDQMSEMKKKYNFNKLLKTYKRKEFDIDDYFNKSFKDDGESEDEKATYFKENGLEEIGLNKKAKESKSKSKSKPKSKSKSKVQKDDSSDYNIHVITESTKSSKTSVIEKRETRNSKKESKVKSKK